MGVVIERKWDVAFFVHYLSSCSPGHFFRSTIAPR
jgi:hypothetical protein